MKTYECITTCTWNGRYWREGTTTPPLEDTVIPPEHFVLINDTEEQEDVVHEETNTNDEIKRGGPGKWKLPSGEVFAGKLAEAKEYWEKHKNK
jgi:hypothetical protein